MKRIKAYLLSFIFAYSTVYSQNLVSTSVLPRNAVLEMFDGINCQYCPDGDYRSTQLDSAFPGRVNIIIIHTGPLADKILPGQPDFRTPFGAAIDSLAGGTTYPSGDMNREVWPGTYSQPPFFPQNPPNNLAIRRPGWWDNAYPTTGTGGAIILNGGNTPVNIGAEAVWNDITRELTVHVELYYTSTESQINKLNVVLLENNLVGMQSTLSGYDSSYVHNHVLRHMLTGQWGDSITTTSQGMLVSRIYTYTVPSGWVIDNCDIAAFVTRDDNKTTHTGITIAAKNGTTVGIGTPIPVQPPHIVPNPVSEQLNIVGLDPRASDIRIVNMIGNTVLSLGSGKEFISADISVLPSGVYFVSYSLDGKTSVMRFVKD